MNKNEIMNAKLSNKFSKLKQTRTTPKLAFSKFLALSLLLISVLVAKFNNVNAAAIAIVGDNKENAKEVVSIAENKFDNNDAEGMATASTLKLQKQHQNKTQNNDGPAAFQQQISVRNSKFGFNSKFRNSKFRYAQKWSLT